MAVDKIDQLEIGSTKYDIDLPPDAEVSIKSVNASDSIKVNGTEVLKTTDISDWAKASTKPTYTANEVGALPSTTKYAASSSVGGPATSAAKLTNTAKIGDINKPVYFTANGVPEAISYTIATSVPSGAVFTDTQSDWSVTDSTSKAFIKNKPTIPTVNNGTLTIQKNGTNVQTFTANQSTNVTANITVPTTYSDVGAAAAHHLYHTWDNNTNYYDNYEGGNMFRIVTENMYADCFRFQASTVSNLEYYNGSSWVSWDFDLSNLFDGNARTGVSIPYANRKFRFQLTANGGWPTTALFMLQGTWFSDGGWPSGQKSSIIIETRANTSADWSQKASFDLSGVQGMAGHTLSSLHTGQTLYRITIEIAPWTNTSNACPLRRLCLFSNYNGGALEKITHDGNGNVTIPTLKSTTIYENGTSLASKYQKILPTTTTAGKVLKSTTTAGTVEWADDTNTNQTIKVGSTTFGANDVVGLVAGTNIDSITADASAKTITINAKDTTYSSKAAASGGTDVSLVTTGEKYTWNNKQDKIAATGSTTKPVYFSAAGTVAACSTYAGGTAVTLNGTSKAASTASFYAPTSYGSSGQFLKSAGANASPTWETVTIPSKTSELTNDSGYTTNTGTVTSVRVQAGTGLSSSTSTASTTTLDTTISIASGYKLLTNSEYNTLNAKQDKISVGTNGQLLSSNGSSLVWTNDNRSLLHHDLGVTIENTTTDGGWSMFNSSYDGFLLKSVRFNANSPSWGVGDYGSGIVFGGSDTKGVISVAYRTPYIKIAGGNEDRPKWWIKLTGTSATSYDLDELKAKPSRVTGSWSVSTTNPGPMVDIILDHPDIKIYYKTYTSSTRTTDVASVLFNASHNKKQGIYALTLRYINASGSLTTIGAGTIYYEYFE